MIFLKFSLFLLISISSAWATNCAPKNFITETNSPFQKIPVYDQDGIGICYAYAASQLVDYHLIKNGAQSRTVHPVWAALSYAKEIEKANQSLTQNLSSGNTKQTIDAIVKSNCSYDIVNRSLGVWAKKANVTDAELVYFLETYVGKYHELYKERTEKSGEPITENDILTLFNETMVKAIEKCSWFATWEQLLPMLKNVSILTAPDMIAGLLVPDCTPTVAPLNLPKIQSKHLSNNENKILDQISSQIDKLNTPISISYCSKFLQDPKYVGIPSRRLFREVALQDDCERHESVIAGKKTTANGCSLLIRNSWGSAFSDWTKNKKCLCRNKQTGAYVDDCSISTHNNGRFTVEGCWVEEEQIKKNAYIMTSIGN